MIQRCGIILLDKTEITIRIYEINHSEWKLLQYQNIKLRTSEAFHKNDTAMVIESLADFLSEDGTAISEWKIAARSIPSSNIQQISAAIGINIETVSPLREQELLCKGLFTELW